MYSLILMTAMAGTPDVASFGWETGGCYGSGGGVSVGCSGYAPAACYGSCGGYVGPLFPRAAAVARFTARATVGTLATVLRPFSGYGYGGCYGSACYGSTSYGSSCLGSSYYGSAAYGGCYGTGYSTGGIGYAPMHMGYGVGSFGTSEGVMVCDADSVQPLTYSQAPTATTPPTVVVAAKPIEMPTPSVANISIEMPANAKVFVDGQFISGSGEKRQFHTPALPKGQAYFYDVKAEIEVNGKTEVEEKRVVLKAGDELKESFPKLFAAIRASGTTSVAAK